MTSVLALAMGLSMLFASSSFDLGRSYVFSNLSISKFPNLLKKMSFQKKIPNDFLGLTGVCCSFSLFISNFINLKFCFYSFN